MTAEMHAFLMTANSVCSLKNRSSVCSGRMYPLPELNLLQTYQLDIFMHCTFLF